MSPPIERTELLEGTIVAHTSSFLHVRVRLTTGGLVEAVIPKTVLRKLGCLFGELLGWNVRMVDHVPPRMPRVVKLWRPGCATILLDEQQS